MSVIGNRYIRQKVPFGGLRASTHDISTRELFELRAVCCVSIENGEKVTARLRVKNAELQSWKILESCSTNFKNDMCNLAVVILPNDGAVQDNGGTECGELEA